MSLRGECFGYSGNPTTEEEKNLPREELVAFIRRNRRIFLPLRIYPTHAAGELMGFDAVVGGRYILFVSTD